MSQTGCAKEGKRISDIVVHFQEKGHQIEPLDDKKILAYEHESGNLLHITDPRQNFGGDAIQAVRRIQEQESFLIGSIPVTFFRCRNKLDAMYIHKLLKRLELNNERAISIFSGVVDNRGRQTTPTTTSRKGRLIVLIQHAKMDNNGRIRARLRKNDVMIGLIKETFEKVVN